MKKLHQVVYINTGTFIAALFPIAGVLADLIRQGKSVSPAQISNLYGSNPIHWIILLVHIRA